MSSVFQPVREAHRLWLQTDDQLSLEVDDLTSLPGADPFWRSGRIRSEAPGSPHNTNGRAGTPPRVSASTAEKGTS